MRLVTLFAFAAVVFILGLFVGTSVFHMHDASGRTLRPWESKTQAVPVTPQPGAPVPPNLVQQQATPLPSPAMPTVPLPSPALPAAPLPTPRALPAAAPAPATYTPPAPAPLPAALARATQYAKDRVVFGRPIGQNQAIQHPLAESWAELEAADMMMRKAAALYDSGAPCGIEANAAKFLGARAGCWLAWYWCCGATGERRWRGQARGLDAILRRQLRAAG